MNTLQNIQSKPKQAGIFNPSLHPQADQIAAMIEAGELYGGDGNVRHDQQDYDKWPRKKKIKYCSRRVNNFGLRKLIRGPVKRIPRYCNHCEDCYKAKALQLKTKVEGIAQRAAADNPDGQWRKKVVSTGKEADSLKKHVKRNQDGRHIEVACTDGSGKVEVWSYIEIEAGRDMDKIYGFEASLDGIDFDALYRTNRSTGKKLSTGGAFRSSPGPKDEDTERMTLPDIIIKDTDRLDEAEQIISDVNFIKEAETSEEVKRLYAYQFGLVLKALEEARIEIAAIKMSFYNMAKEDAVNEWNLNVAYWKDRMSINAPLSTKSNGAKVDISRLVFPKSGEKEGNALAN